MADTKDLTETDYITRRDALIEGDAGVLETGKTCAETRSDYETLATTEPAPTR